jgi:hypothetical protein
MTNEEWQDLTIAQRNAFRDLQERSGLELDALIASAYAPTSLSPYVGIPNFHGMFVGIEPDGYTHT